MRNGEPNTGQNAVQAESRGMVALMTVIIMGVLLLVVGLSTTYIGQTEIIIAGQMDRGQHARTRAAACIEEALYRLKQDSDYSGSSMDVGDVICSVTVTGSDSTRTITSSANSSDFNKTIEATVALWQNSDETAKVWTITSWQEVEP